MNVGVRTARPSACPGELVSGTYFQVLGVGAAIGRVITPDDDKERGGEPGGRAQLRLLAQPLRRRPAASSGKTITVNNHTFTIIGVSQAGFDGVDIGYVPSMRVPLMMKAQMTPNWDDVDNRRSRWVNVFGRLKPGVTREQAQTALQPFFHGLLEQEVLDAAVQQHDARTRASSSSRDRSICCRRRRDDRRSGSSCRSRCGCCSASSAACC